MPFSGLEDRKVLFVDDDAELCESMTEALEAEGLEPICATRDQEAEEALRRHQGRFAVVVVDINLRTGTTGFDVARYARSINPRLPVLFISGLPSPGMSRFGVEGAAFLEKPFSPSELVSALGALLEQG